ncbi:hypothetical protein ACFFRR_004928 [Megaselia abdita]
MTEQNNCEPQVGRKKICFCYFITTLFISITIFIVVIASMENTSKIGRLQYTTEELSRLVSSSFKEQHDNPAPQATTPCPSESVEDIIKKHFAELWNEITATNLKVDKLSQTRIAELNECGGNPHSDKDKMVNAVSRVNYASDVLGAQIVSVKDKPWHKASKFVKVLSWILPGLVRYTNGPRQLITDSVLPGNCYAFKSKKSTVVIKLPFMVNIDSVSLEHISASQSPSGNLTSAPKDFEVHGLMSMKPKDDYYFGSFVYDIDSEPLQLFTFQNPSSKKFNLIKFQFNSNYGHRGWTCVYK